MTFETAMEKLWHATALWLSGAVERVAWILEQFGNPQHQLQFIHVAGTNGKGSTCAMLSSILREAGYQTGLFVSPYIIEFRERIQVNGDDSQRSIRSSYGAGVSICRAIAVIGRAHVGI